MVVVEERRIVVQRRTSAVRILIVEDEEALAKGLKLNFELEGYVTVHAPDGPSALREFETADPRFDLVVLDLMLPGLSGYEVCRTIREQNAGVPVLVLSARTLAEDKALAFDLGTDQYMTKPFALPELLSRVKNLLSRRSAGPFAGASSPPASPQQSRFGNVVVDFKAFEVDVDGQKHQLTTLEMQLLRYFIEHEGAVLSRSEILRDVWDESADVTTRSIDNFVLRLRRIIERNPAEPKHILSVRGTGYRFLADGDGQG